MKNFFLGILTVIIIGAVALIAYQTGKKTVVNIPIPATSTPIATLTPVSDNELIKAALYKKNNWQDNEVTVTVNTNDGTYASGTAGSSGGGGYFYAAKVSGVWKIVADGNGVISCTDLAAYPNFPKTLIPECYDQTTQKSIKR